MKKELSSKLHSSYNSYLESSRELRSITTDFVKEALNESENKEIVFDFDSDGEYREVCDENGDIYTPSKVFIDGDDVMVNLSKDYDTSLGDIEAYYLAEIAYAVEAHLLNNKK
jgi:hypothetical protein